LTPQNHAATMAKNERISLHWIVNYLGFFSVEVFILIQLWMDADHITEGRLYVLLNFTGNVLLAYLTSWFFLLVIEQRDKIHVRQFYRVHLEEIFNRYAGFIHSLAFLHHRVEDVPYNTADYARISKYIVKQYHREDITGITVLLRPVLVKMLAAIKLELERTVNRMKERRNNDDELFRLLDQLTYSFWAIPEIDPENQERDVKDDDFADCVYHWFLRIHRLETYCIRKGLIKPTLIGDQAMFYWGYRGSEDPKHYEMMRKNLAKRKERTTMSQAIEKARAAGELMELED
jgi:hypothetical protein